jgi:putative sporulation protein YyaC
MKPEKNMSNTNYFNMKEQYVQWKLNNTLLETIKGVNKQYRNISVVCIGTDRSTGDSFGPLTGHMLSRLTLIDFDLYGTLESPVHALSLSEVMSGIDTGNSLIIAVDAGMGDAGLVGSIGIGYEPVKPGSGLGKTLPCVGDISITGIVAMGGIAPFIMLQNAPLGMVYCMAEKTFFAIQYALRIIQLERRADVKQKGINMMNTVKIDGGLLSSYTKRNG